MVTNHIIVLCMFLLSSLSHAASIVKNIPGFHGDLPFTLETGYVGVGAEDEVQLFYYFVESERDPLHDPLILYITGGPGTTAVYPFLFQIGPLSVNHDNSTWEKVSLELNPNSWAKWIEEHPRFLSNPLYVAGISYMGIIVPPVTLEVYKGNERKDQPQLNIKGYMIVSPLTDKFSDFNSRFEFAHRVALISDDIYESGKNACHGNYAYNDPENIECSNIVQRADECTSKINALNILDPYCYDGDIDPNCKEATAIYLKYFGNDKEVQEALHVREGTIAYFEMINETIHYNFKKEDNECYSYDIWSSIVYHKMLLSRNCQVLILSGDQDFTFPYVGAEQWITSLNLPIESPWNPWFVNNQVAGYQMKYAKNGYSLTYATVKAAGHSIALYKPEEAWVILDRWLASQSYLNDS